jgi:hypothetical protein
VKDEVEQRQREVVVHEGRFRGVKVVSGVLRVSYRAGTKFREEFGSWQENRRGWLNRRESRNVESASFASVLIVERVLSVPRWSRVSWTSALSLNSFLLSSSLLHPELLLFRDQLESGKSRGRGRGGLAAAGAGGRLC